jgi:hypothetical protein
MKRLRLAFQTRTSSDFYEPERSGGRARGCAKSVCAPNCTTACVAAGSKGKRPARAAHHWICAARTLLRTKTLLSCTNARGPMRYSSSFFFKPIATYTTRWRLGAGSSCTVFSVHFDSPVSVLPLVWHDGLRAGYNYICRHLLRCLSSPLRLAVGSGWLGWRPIGHIVHFGNRFVSV